MDERLKRKRCLCCGLAKSFDAFPANQFSKDGLHNWCRACVLEDKKRCLSEANQKKRTVVDGTYTV